VEVPLHELAPRRYVLRVEASTRLDERPVIRDVPFEIREERATTTY
jgi:hypothetical protein